LKREYFIHVTLQNSKYNVFYNLVIIFWLFLPLFIIFLALVGVYFSTNFDSTLNEFNFRFIFSNIINNSGESGGKQTIFENFTVIIALMGSFLLYCYFFNLIQKKGFSILKLEGQDSKFSSALPYIFFLSLISLYWIALAVKNVYQYLEWEIFLIIILLVILILSIYFYSKIMKKTSTYNGLVEFDEIKQYERTIPLGLGIKNQISFCLTFFDLYPLILFVFTLFTVLFYLKFNFSIFTLIITECILIYLSIIYSSICIIPKNKITIFYKNKPFPDKDVFLLSESSKDYYTILFDNNRIEFVMRDTISHIIPNEEFNKINEFKAGNPLDEIREIFTLKNFLYLFGFSFFIAGIILILGTFVYLGTIIFFSSMHVFLIILSLIIIGTIGLKFHNQIITIFDYTWKKIVIICNILLLKIKEALRIFWIILVKLCIFCYLFPESFPEIFL